MVLVQKEKERAWNDMVANKAIVFLVGCTSILSLLGRTERKFEDGKECNVRCGSHETLKRHNHVWYGAAFLKGFISRDLVTIYYLLHIQKSLVMRIRIAYKTNDKDVLEEAQINNFPRDL